jgi:hypothetical protein
MWNLLKVQWPFDIMQFEYEGTYNVRWFWQDCERLCNWFIMGCKQDNMSQTQLLYWEYCLKYSSNKISKNFKNFFILSYQGLCKNNSKYM